MPNPTESERDKLIAEVIALLYEAKAYTWPIQDKAMLTAAVRLQLDEKPAPAGARRKA